MSKDQKKRERALDMNGGVDEQGQAADWRTVKPCHFFLVTQDLFGGQSEMKTQKQPLQKAEQSSPSLPFSSSWWAQAGRLEDTTTPWSTSWEPAIPRPAVCTGVGRV